MTPTSGIGTPQRTRRPTQNDRILALLQAGPKTTHEILRHVPCIVHSRVAELRERGYAISCRRDGDNYTYTLHASPDDLLDEPDTGPLEGRRSPSSPPVSGSSSGPSAAATAYEAPSASRSSGSSAPDDARSALTLFPVQQGAYGDVAA